MLLIRRWEATRTFNDPGIALTTGSKKTIRYKLHALSPWSARIAVGRNARGNAVSRLVARPQASSAASTRTTLGAKLHFKYAPSSKHSQHPKLKFHLLLSISQNCALNIIYPLSPAVLHAKTLVNLLCVARNQLQTIIVKTPITRRVLLITYSAKTSIIFDLCSILSHPQTFLHYYLSLSIPSLSVLQTAS